MARCFRLRPEVRLAVSESSFCWATPTARERFGTTVEEGRSASLATWARYLMMWKVPTYSWRVAGPITSGKALPLDAPEAMARPATEARPGRQLTRVGFFYLYLLQESRDKEKINHPRSSTTAAAVGSSCTAV